MANWKSRYKKKKPTPPSERVVEIDGQRFLLKSDGTFEPLPEEPVAPPAPRRRGRRRRTGRQVSTKPKQAGELYDFYELYEHMPHDEAIHLSEVEWKRWLAVQDGAPNAYIRHIKS